MARVIFVEVLDNRGQLRSRVRLEAFPATIGRGYDNDVIIDDPYVCPRHARLLLDGERALIVEDAGSVNGVQPIHGSTSGRQAQLSVLPGGTFRLGRTTLRIAEAGQSVPPALIDRADDAAWLPKLLTAGSSVAILVVAFVLLAVQTYLASFERIGFAKVVSESLPALLLFALWAGGWALASRIVSHRFNFLSHIAVVAAVFTTGVMMDSLIEWLIFLFPGTELLDVLQAFLFVLLTAVLLYGHLSFVSPLAPARRWGAALGVTATIFAIGGFIAMAEDDDFSSDLDYPSVLKPVSSRWVQSVSIDEFTKASETLKASVDSLVEE
ncbi:MAG TPA: FHA domain-containing protein [Gemmatimonadaceae bacterium]|nr:FHA domain-containing protein [Gemmatimonadaceae bacterium]